MAGSVHWGILDRYFVERSARGPLEASVLFANVSSQFREDLMARKVHTLVPHNWRWRSATTFI